MLVIYLFPLHSIPFPSVPCSVAGNYISQAPLPFSLKRALANEWHQQKTGGHEEGSQGISSSFLLWAASLAAAESPLCSSFCQEPVSSFCPS